MRSFENVIFTNSYSADQPMGYNVDGASIMQQTDKKFIQNFAQKS